MRETGLEPVRAAPHAPQTCASADSATLAYLLLTCFYRARAWLLRCPKFHCSLFAHETLTAAPFRSPFIVHRTQSNSMLPIGATVAYLLTALASALIIYHHSFLLSIPFFEKLPFILCFQYGRQPYYYCCLDIYVFTTQNSTILSHLNHFLLNRTSIFRIYIPLRVLLKRYFYWLLTFFVLK